MDAESFTLHLSVDECGKAGETECSYYMWRQRFPVPQKNRVDRRKEVDDWMVTLAFPSGKRQSRGMTCPGIYAFLPTEMITNLPFIIQADFLLQSSREAILMDDVWNQGILDCVPVAFVNAFTSLVKTVVGAPMSSLATMFSFLPIKESTYQKLNDVRNSIRTRILQEDIIPSEVIHSDQRLFRKPCEVARLMPSFWNILLKAKKQGVGLHSLSSHGKYVLHSSFDREEYKDVLEFLSIGHLNNEWYSQCIRSTNLVLGVDEDTYVDLLNFVAVNWSSHFRNTGMQRFPLLKYNGPQGTSSLYSINEITVGGGQSLCRSADSRYASWLISSSKELKWAGRMYFFPKETQKAISKKGSLVKWIELLGMKTLTVRQYAKLTYRHMSSDSMLSIGFAHFLYHSLAKGYLTTSDCQSLCNLMPLVDSYGQVRTQRSDVVLVPGNGSIWVQLFGLNPWRRYGYIEIQEEYLNPRHLCGCFTPKGALVDFFKKNAIASDIPDILPPNFALLTVVAPLTKKSTFLLLDWIHSLQSKGLMMPSNFLKSIKEWRWLRVSVSGSSSDHSPSASFLSNSSWDDFNQKSALMDAIPVIDEKYYDHRLSFYMEELKMIGVSSEWEDVCKFLVKHFMSMSCNSCLTRNNVEAVLYLIRYMKEKYLSPVKLASVVKRCRLRTSQGYKLPAETVLYDEGWKSASLVSNIPFIDAEFYGHTIHHYKTELELLGVVNGFSDHFQLVVDYLNPFSRLNELDPEALILLLNCIRVCASTSSDKLVSSLKKANCLKTSCSYLSPTRCFLSEPRWGCILDIFDCIPVIDQHFYGHDIQQYKEELKKLGVVVNWKDAMEGFLNVFEEKVKSSFLTKAEVLSLLLCCRKLNELGLDNFAAKIIRQTSGAKWLRTRLGDFRSPKECILFSSQWVPLSEISGLPFIDDSDTSYGMEVHKYKNELMSMGIVVDVENIERFVKHIRLPREMPPTKVFCLLRMVQIMLNGGKTLLPEPFLKRISKKWLKTKFGYQIPKKSILFGPKWKSFLQSSDGPFIDNEYYGPSLCSYSKELQAIGVVIDIADGTSLLASSLKLLPDSYAIKRVYAYLSYFYWKPKDKTAKLIWVPNSTDGSADGMWVSASECVLRDEDGFFGSKVYVLDKRGYGPEHLSFFSRAFRVRSHPSMDDYMQLWIEWERSEHKPSHVQCCAFWAYVVKHWDTKTKNIVRNNLSRVPASSDGDEIQLIDKREIFIPDDLVLEDLFENSDPSLPLFVWTARPSDSLIPYSRLLEIYKSIGVKMLSESVVRAESSLVTDGDNFSPVMLGDVFLRRGLFILLLGFLSGHELNLAPEVRHEIVKSLMEVTAYESTEPMTVSYTLPLSSSSSSDVNVKASVMVRWEKDKSEFFAQQLDRLSGQKGVVEYATNFAQVVSRGLLLEKEKHIPKLEEHIRFGFVVDFDEEAIVHYLKSENLQIFLEDEKFLTSAFVS